MAEMKNVGLHAENLASGQILAPGESAPVDEEGLKDPFNADLIDRGILIDVSSGEEPNATDAAKDLAEREGVELASVTGTGADGRITQNDVERTIAETSAEGRSE
jgi:pyruvate/2-oxoglutarate dehydrogenase complex dihydrolipoamide acyltransferase (E2) component